MADAATLEAPWLAGYPAGIDWRQAFPRETLNDQFAASVARFGPRPCLDFLGRRWTYAQIGAAVEHAAGGLQRLGIGPGSRVGLCLPNSPFYVIAYFAALRAGAVVVNYSPLYVEAELAAQAADSGTEVMVTVDLDPLLPRALALLDRDGPVKRVIACRFADALTPVKSVAFRIAKRRNIARVPADPRVTPWRDVVGGAPIADAPAVRPDDLAVLQYTGGTTGVPKGAMLTHANLAANARQVQCWDPSARAGEERTLAVIPFFHVFAMTVALNAALLSGSEIVALPRFEVKPTLAALRRRRPTIFPGVPTLFRAVLDGGATREDLGSVRQCISGGAPLPAAIKQRFETASGGTLVEGYGLTEASPVCFCNPTAGGRAGTIGVPLPGVEACIRDLETGAVLPPGGRGELCVRGPNVMAGYLDRPEETANVLDAEGWLRTGDVGIMDADGYVELVDRIKDLILCSGFNVYPRVVEEAIYTHPDVAAVTVVGMPDSYRGESAAAFVEPHPGRTPTPEAIAAFLEDKLSPVERPRLIEIRDALPRTAVGKLSKKELRAELLARTPAA